MLKKSNLYIHEYISIEEQGSTSSGETGAPRAEPQKATSAPAETATATPDKDATLSATDRKARDLEISRANFFNGLATLLEKELDKTLPGKEADILIPEKGNWLWDTGLEMIKKNGLESAFTTKVPEIGDIQGYKKNMPEAHIRYYIGLVDAFNRKDKNLLKILFEARQKESIRRGTRQVIAALTATNRLFLIPSGRTGYKSIYYKQGEKDALRTTSAKGRLWDSFVPGMNTAGTVAIMSAVGLMPWAFAAPVIFMGLAAGPFGRIAAEDKLDKKYRSGGPEDQEKVLRRRFLAMKNGAGQTLKNVDQLIDQHINEDFSIWYMINNEEDQKNYRAMQDVVNRSIKKVSRHAAEWRAQITAGEVTLNNQPVALVKAKKDLEKDLSAAFNVTYKGSRFHVKDGMRDLVQVHLLSPSKQLAIRRTTAAVKRASTEVVQLANRALGSTAPITSWPDPDSDDQQAREYNVLRAYKLAFDTSRGGQYKTANRGFQRLSPEMQRILQDLRRRDKLQGGIFGVPGIKMDNKEMLQAAFEGDLPSEWLLSSTSMSSMINSRAVRLKNELEKTLPGKESEIIFPYMRRWVSSDGKLGKAIDPPKWAPENFRGGQIPAWAEVYYYRLFEAYNNLSGVKGKSNLLSDLLKSTTQNLPMRLGERALITTLTKHNKIFLLDDVWSKDVLGQQGGELGFKFVSMTGVFGTFGQFFKTLMGLTPGGGIAFQVITTMAGAGLALARANSLTQQFPDGASDMAKRRGGVLVKPSEANNQKSIKKIIDNLIGEAKFLVDNGQLGLILIDLRQSLGDLHKELRTEQEGKKTSDSKSPKQVKKELVKYIHKLEKICKRAIIRAKNTGCFVDLDQENARDLVQTYLGTPRRVTGKQVKKTLAAAEEVATAQSGAGGEGAATRNEKPRDKFRRLEKEEKNLIEKIKGLLPAKAEKDGIALEAAKENFAAIVRQIKDSESDKVKINDGLPEEERLLDFSIRFREKTIPRLKQYLAQLTDELKAEDATPDQGGITVAPDSKKPSSGEVTVGPGAGQPSSGEVTVGPGAEQPSSGEVTVGPSQAFRSRRFKAINRSRPKVTEGLINAVIDLQHWLVENNFAPKKLDNETDFVDGIWGGSTREAIERALQGKVLKERRLNENAGVDNLRIKLNQSQDIKKDAFQLYKALSGLGKADKVLAILNKYLSVPGSANPHAIKAKNLKKSFQGIYELYPSLHDKHTQPNADGTGSTNFAARKHKVPKRKQDEQVILLYWHYTKLLNNLKKRSSGDLVNWLLDESSSSVKFQGEKLFYLLKIHGVQRSYGNIELKNNISKRIYSFIDFFRRKKKNAAEAHVHNRIINASKKFGKEPQVKPVDIKAAKLKTKAKEDANKRKEIQTFVRNLLFPVLNREKIKITGTLNATLSTDPMKFKITGLNINDKKTKLQSYFDSNRSFLKDIYKAVDKLQPAGDDEEKRQRNTRLSKALFKRTGDSSGSLRSFVKKQRIIIKVEEDSINFTLPRNLFYKTETQKYVSSQEAPKSAQKTAAAAEPSQSQARVKRYIESIQRQLKKIYKNIDFDNELGNYKGLNTAKYLKLAFRRSKKRK